MERAVTRPRTPASLITPAADGWRVRSDADDSRGAIHPTLSAAAAALPDGAPIRLSLPVGSVLMERMQLPSTEAEELSGMVVLQLEKSLPFAGDEVTSGFEVVHREENESDLLAFAVSNEQLDALCAPLREQRKIPEHVGIFATQLAAACAHLPLVALVFRELDSTILAVVDHGKLATAQACASTDRDEFLSELPRLLLTLELEGIPVNFTKVLLEQDLAGWQALVGEHFGGIPVELLPMDRRLETGSINLVPSRWTEEHRRLSRSARLKERLILAGILYLLLLLLAAGYIIWLQRQVSAIDAQVAASAPAVDLITARKARWTALLPAIDPSRSTVEILNQVTRSIPGDALQITLFRQEPGQFMVEGEAPTGNAALEYEEALKKNPDLSAFHFEAGPPEPLPNEHAHFRIFGKL